MNLRAPVCFLICGVICLGFSACVNTSHPENIAFLQARLRQYHDNGAYMRQFTVVADAARRSLAQEKIPTTKKPAIVFDIDETLLSNWPYLNDYNFGGNMPLMQAWFARGQASGLPPTIALYKEARRLGYTVFLITGRWETTRSGTVANLHRMGITEYAALTLRPLSDHNDSVIPYKSARRKQIESEGYQIVLNIGDQWSDLEGGYALHTYKLPNPFYFIR